MKKTKREKRLFRLTCFFMWLGFVGVFMTIWVMKAMPGMDTAAIMFQFKVPLEGTDWAAFYGMFACIFLWPTMAAALVLWGLHFARKMKVQWKLVIAVLLTVLSFGIGLNYIKFFKYMKDQVVKTKLYEEMYVNPAETAVHFPETKRNLIYIYLESMEITFTSKEVGGVNQSNVMPNLTALALDNITFNGGGETLEGPVSVNGTTWTMASFVAQNCGIPLTIPLKNNAMDKYSSFLPGATGLGQFLEQAGYRQTVIIGSKKTFSGFDTFLASHGNPYVLDLQGARDLGYLPSADYFAWWGYEDKYLFANAKREILKLNETEEPYAVTLMTMDTHRVDGYRCSLCKHDCRNQYEDVLSCSDRQVAEFVTWLQSLPTYENTTIIIAGDHQTMDGDYVNTLTIPKNYQRKQYYTIINADPQVVSQANASGVFDSRRAFSTLDLFPTTLAAIGCTIDGNRLGLGTNLFSTEKTLLEEKGLAWLDSELGKNSDFYKSKLLYGE